MRHAAPNISYLLYLPIGLGGWPQDDTGHCVVGVMSDGDDIPLTVRLMLDRLSSTLACSK